MQKGEGKPNSVLKVYEKFWLLNLVCFWYYVVDTGRSPVMWILVLFLPCLSCDILGKSVSVSVSSDNVLGILTLWWERKEEILLEKYSRTSTGTSQSPFCLYLSRKDLLKTYQNVILGQIKYYRTQNSWSLCFYSSCLTHCPDFSTVISHFRQALKPQIWVICLPSPSFLLS